MTPGKYSKQKNKVRLSMTDYLTRAPENPGLLITS